MTCLRMSLFHSNSKVLTWSIYNCPKCWNIIRFSLYIEYVGYFYLQTEQAFNTNIYLHLTEWVNLTSRILLMASNMTRITFASLDTRRSHSGFITPNCTRYAICSTVPPEVRLVIAQTASFWLLKSPLKKKNYLSM